MDRTTFIGASEAAAIIGISPWQTPMDIWRRKVAPEPEPENEQLQWGTLLEPLILRQYADRKNIFLLHDRQRTFSRANVTCHVDAISYADPRGPVIVEAKSTREPYWPGVPDYYDVQVQVQMELADMDFCDVATLHQGNTLQIYEVKRDRQRGAALVETCQEWWHKHIINGEPETPINDDDFAHLYPRHTPDKEMEATPSIESMVNRICDLKASEREVKEELKEAMLEVKLAMKDAEKLIGQDGRVLVTFKTAQPSRIVDTKALIASLDAEYVARYFIDRLGSRRFLVK